jgi:hypothetical protein
MNSKALRVSDRAVREKVRVYRKGLRMRVLHFGKLLLIAAIPSVILPVLFFVLAMYNSSGTRRDVVPTINNVWGMIGWFGGLPLWIPIMAMSAGVGSLADSAHAHGYVIPVLDALGAEMQTRIVLGIGFASNLALWLIPISLLDWLMRQWKLMHKRNQTF